MTRCGVVRVLILTAVWGRLAAAQATAFVVTPLPLVAGCSPSSQKAGYTQILAGDFNGDSKTDLAFLCPTASGQHQIVVFPGNGDGTFQAPTVLSNTSSNRYFVSADFNGDGITDIAVFSDAPGFSDTTWVWLGTKNGISHSGVPGFVNYVFHSDDAPVAADLNGDGIPDLVDYNHSVAFYGNGSGTFPVRVDLSIFPPVSNSGPFIGTGVVVGDFNADGKADLAVTGFYLGQSSTRIAATYLLLGRDRGTFLPAALLMNVAGSSIVAGDFNGDEKIDLVIGDSDSVAFYTLLGNGNGTFQSPIKTAGFSGPFAAADINGDGKTDLALPASDTQSVAILLSRGDGTFELSNQASIGDTPNNILTADFNGDGKPDFATSNSHGGSILINTPPFNSVTSVLNGASFAHNQPVAPGSLVSVFGMGFVPDSTVFHAAAIPLPTSLGEVSVAFNGIPAPLLFVSATQINAQMPWDVLRGALSGRVNAVATVKGKAFPAFQFQVESITPAIFNLQGGVGQAVAINPGGTIAGVADSIPGVAMNPAKAGDALVILGTGLGPVSPMDADGVGSLDALRKATTMPIVLIGGAPAEVSFAGLSPQFVGVNQINVVVPKVGIAGVVPLQINSGGILTSDQVTIAVENRL